MNTDINAQWEVINKVAGISDMPEGAYNIRVDGKSIGRSSTKAISIKPKEGVSGIDITVAPGTKKDSVHIPVAITASGHAEMVYNDFFIGEGADVTIVAGCGIHNCGAGLSQHDGVHAFYIEKNAKVKYIEKHYGSGDGTGERILNPVTEIHLAENSYMEIDTVQIEGVDSSKRVTRAELADGATLIIREKIMTHGSQFAETDFEVELNGEGANTHLVSRAVAKDCSRQVFLAKMHGNNKCRGHSECDAIIMDEARVTAIPEIVANNVESTLIHEAAIGKIAGEQLIKLMTLGLSEKEAEREIINGFLM